MFKKIFLAALMIVVMHSGAQAQEEHINHTELKWNTIETPHFYVHYHDGEERTARVAAAVAEDIYGPVTSLYDHRPDQKVSLIMNDFDDYSNGAAYFYDNKIQLWAPALDFDLRGTHNWLRNVITHEFTHIVQIQTSMKFGRHVPGFYIQWLNYEDERRQDVLYGYPNTIVSYPFSGFVVPSWFAEGVAQYNRPEIGYDSWDSHRDMILRMYALDGKMLTWNEMSVFGKTSLGNESAYNAGFALVKYISETYGADAIPRIAKNLSRINAVTIDQAIDRAIGKSGIELYREWQRHVTEQYRMRTSPIEQNKVEGETIGGVGFGNFYPAYSPDGTKIAYTSNKEADYFGWSSIYVYDTATKKEKELVKLVRSSLSWSPDGTKLYYSRTDRDNPHWSNIADLYVYDMQKEEETRLTHGQRAFNPSLSPDGTQLACAISHDGTMNLTLVSADGKTVRTITDFKNGEQVFTPKWSPDGKELVFGYAKKDGQDVARVNAATGAMEILVPGDDDARNPVYAADGRSIVFASDRTGIFNLYRLTLETKAIDQLTNVLGGAFMPSVNAAGDIAFSSYTSSGFKLNVLAHPAAQNFASASYLPAPGKPLASLSAPEAELPRNQFDFAKLRNYDDDNLPAPESKPYKNVFTSLSVIPFLRIDNYNTKSSGLDFLKPGLYFTSGDVVDKMSMFGGAAINTSLERDLFLIFDYRGGIAGLKQLGINPTASFEVYNITRKSTGDLELGLDKYTLDVTYGMLEFDLNLKQHLLSEADVLTLGASYSRYSADLGSFVIKGDENNAPVDVPGSSDLYFKGFTFSAQWDARAIMPSSTSEINPVGSSMSVRYEYAMDKFNSTGEYDQTQTGLTPHLSSFNFSRLEARATHHMPLPGWKHTLSMTLHGGTIFGPPVPDFFDFYVGGLPGMKGYPYYSISGNTLAAVNLAYRFPMWENIDFRILQLYFDKLYGEVHADFGNAWTKTTRLQDFKKDVGFELRLEAFSFYAYPTRFFFNGTYGLDQFNLVKKDMTVSYGKEWRFYFGILFGFDFSNDIGRSLKNLF
ncbi:MAG: biopolymer transporter Tol [Acidobacteriota bacterium]